jgi:NDP-sugar pyrophosphorylase family protein
MIPVHGRPFLEYELSLLRSSGIDEVVLCVGYLGEKIEERIGDGRKFGVSIRYSRDGKELLGPIGALKKAEGLLDQTFFVTYGDAYLRLDYQAMMNVLMQGNALGVMAVYRNKDEFGKSDAIIRDGHVIDYDKKEKKPGMVWINFGVSALKKTALGQAKEGEYCDEEPFYQSLIRARQLLSFEVRERFYEIGNPKGLKEFSDFAKVEEILLGRPPSQLARQAPFREDLQSHGNFLYTILNK